MASENAVAIRVRITRGIGTPQLLGRLDSTPGQAARQSRNLLHYVGLVPPIAVGFARQSKGCLTIFDLNFRTGFLKKAFGTEEVRRSGQRGRAPERILRWLIELDG
jgi:hypothetical protein